MKEYSSGSMVVPGFQHAVTYTSEGEGQPVMYRWPDGSETTCENNLTAMHLEEAKWLLKAHIDSPMIRQLIWNKLWNAVIAGVNADNFPSGWDSNSVPDETL